MKALPKILMILLGISLVAVSVCIKSLTNAGMVTICLVGLLHIVAGVILLTIRK